MYKKTLISLAVASSLVVTGCFEDSRENKNAGPTLDITQPGFDGRVWPNFDPVAGRLPIPSDLNFTGSTDLSFVVAGSSDNPVIGALNQLSGSSTVAPAVVRFSGRIDPDTVDSRAFVMVGDSPAPNPDQNVFLIELAYEPGVNPVQGLTTAAPSVPIAGVVQAAGGDEQDAETQQAGAKLVGLATAPAYDHEVVELDGTSAIKIRPREPLNPLTKYLVVVTDEVKDLNGQPIRTSPTYNNAQNVDVPIFSGLAGVRSLVTQVWEPVVDSFFALPNALRPTFGSDPLTLDNVALTYTFTTSGDRNVLTSIANPNLWLAGLGAGALDADNFNFPSPKSRGVGSFDITPASELSAVLVGFGGNDVDVMQGSIDLPYYLGLPTDQAGPASLQNRAWRPDQALAGNLSGAIAPLAPFADEDTTNPVNYLFPFPSQNGDDIPVPLLVMTPKGENGDDYDLSAGNYKAVIFQHGITSDRSAALAFGSQLISSSEDDIVVFAIDQPLHGISPSPVTSGREAQDPTSSYQGWAGVLLTGLEEAPFFDEGELANEIFVGALVQSALADDPTPLVDAAAAAYPGDDGEVRRNFISDRAEVLLGTVQRSGSTVAGIAPSEGDVQERHFNFGANAANQIIEMNFDPMNVAGSSGDLFINLQNFTNSRDNLRQGALDLLNLRRTIADNAVFGNPSEVYFVGHSLGTVNGAAFVAAANASQVPELAIAGAHLLTPASGIVRLLENSPAFAPTILGGLQQAAGLTQGDADLETFLNVFQATLDASDPVNFAAELKGSNVVIAQVNGDTTTPNAAIIDGVRFGEDGDGEPRGQAPLSAMLPNPAGGLININSPEAPLAGSEALAFVLGTQDDNDATPSINRFDNARHSTPVLPASMGEQAAFGMMVLDTLELMGAMPATPPNGG